MISLSPLPPYKYLSAKLSLSLSWRLFFLSSLFLSFPLSHALFLYVCLFFYLPLSVCRSPSPPPHTHTHTHTHLPLSLSSYQSIVQLRLNWIYLAHYSNRRFTFHWNLAQILSGDFDQLHSYLSRLFHASNPWQWTAPRSQSCSLVL